MSPSARWLSQLRWLLWLTVASSILHYADNVAHFEHYPEPPWLNRSMVDAFWFIMTPLAWVGYRLIRRGSHFAGSGVLLLYGACNLLTLGHYRYAPFGDIALRIHAFILIEAICAGVLIGFLLLPYLRKYTRPDFPAS